MSLLALLKVFTKLVEFLRKNIIKKIYNEYYPSTDTFVLHHIFNLTFFIKKALKRFIGSLFREEFGKLQFFVSFCTLP